MTLEELLALLNGEAELSAEQRKKLAETTKALIDAEKTKGIESYRKKDAETLKYKEMFKKLGYDKDTTDGIEAFIDGISTLKNSSTEKDLTIAKLTSSVNSINETLEAMKVESQKNLEKAKKETINAKLGVPLSKKFFNHELIVEHLTNNKKVDVINGEVVFKNGEETVTFDDGVKGLEKTFAESLRSTVRGGSETTPTTGGGDFNEMSAEAGLKELGL